MNKKELISAVETIFNDANLLAKFRTKYGTEKSTIIAGIKTNLIKKSAINFIMDLVKVDTTEVMFRFWKGEIIALFPYIIGDSKGNVMSYMHVGQHGSADYDHIIRNSKPATPAQMLPLYQELESIGYNLLVVKRRNYDKYLTEYKKSFR
jgi:hypothetical protein